MNSKPLWFFFISSVWLFIGILIYACVNTVLHFKEVNEVVAGRYHAGVVFGPFVALGLEFFFWRKFFRYPVDGARVFAAFMGLFIFLKIIFVELVVSDLLDKENDSLWLYVYAGLGHLFFSFFGKDRRDVESTFIYYD